LEVGLLVIGSGCSHVPYEKIVANDILPVGVDVLRPGIFTTLNYPFRWGVVGNFDQKVKQALFGIGIELMHQMKTSE
jgi:hypothetical protein